jgi:hypothetical protein
VRDVVMGLRQTGTVLFPLVLECVLKFLYKHTIIRNGDLVCLQKEMKTTNYLSGETATLFLQYADFELHLETNMIIRKGKIRVPKQRFSGLIN